MEYIQKAWELGEVLLNTPVVHKLKEAEAEIAKDPEAAKAFEEYQAKECNLVTAQMFNLVPSEKDSLALIELKMRIIRKYSSIRNFFTLQQDLDKIMATVNMAITITSSQLKVLPHLSYPAHGLVHLDQYLCYTQK